MISQNKRERLVDSAAELFHRNGSANTSLADIAKHADIPIGNVYYYFKAKEDLALAAVAKRKELFSASYAAIDEQITDPRLRLIESVRYFESIREEYARYGCPIGKLIEDSGAEKDPVAQLAAQIYADYVTWAQQQFRQLGHQESARNYALSLLAGVQGAVLMAKAFADPHIITAEIARLTHWIENLPNRRIQLGKVGPRSVEATEPA